MKKNLLINVLKLIMIINNNKNNQETKNIARNNLLKSIPFFALGYFSDKIPTDKIKSYIDSNNLLNNISTNIKVETGMSPIDVINKVAEIGVVPEVSQLLFVLGGLCLLKSLNNETPIQDDLSKLGSDYCPYNSYYKAQNDFRGKEIQMKINEIYNVAYAFKSSTYRRKVFLGIAKASEILLEFISPKYQMVLDFLGKSEKGFTLLKHSNKNYENPKLIEQLPINQKLKELLRPELMDLDHEYRIENTSYTQRIRKRATEKAKKEINERNINLLLVKIIDEIKLGNKTQEDYKTEINKLIDLTEKTSTTWRKKYFELSIITDYIFNKIGIDNFNIKNYNIEIENKYERAYHIMREIDQLCYKKLKCERLKKPIPYREIYINEMVMAVQTMLRGKYADMAIKNRLTQNNSFLIKDHYVNYKIENNYDIIPIIKGRLIIDSDNFNMNENEKKLIIDKIKGKNKEIKKEVVKIKLNKNRRI